MQVIRRSSDMLPVPCVATIGFFDGIHIGHRFLIRQVKEIAANKGLSSALITFPVHPRKVMQSDYRPEILTDCDEKIMLLSEIGIDYCFLLDFTAEMSQLTAREFMARILRACYNVHVLVIGYDHRFGHNREEGFNDYLRYGKELGIEVILARAYTRDNINISSSVIRSLLRDGKVDLAAEYLSYEYFLNGVVVGGNRIGRTIGFPTANIRVNDPDKLVPGEGVYAVRVIVGGQSFVGMLNIGFRPTMNNGPVQSIEVYILHFRADIYNCSIRISFVQRIRSEIKFADVKELTDQLHKDAARVEKLLLPDKPV